MKKLVTIAIAAIAGHILAGTYTWTGAANDGGLWFTAENWNYDGAAASTSPGHELKGNDVVIDGSGVVVTYVPPPQNGDLITQGGTTLTISGGAKLQQNGGAYPFFHGTVVVDGGTLDYKNNETNPSEVRLDGTLFLRNGGQLLCNQLTRSAASARVVIGTGVTYEVDGTVGPEASEMYQQMEGGTLYIGDELRAANGVTYTGSGTINCWVFAPQAADSVVTFNGPNLILRRANTDFYGFWQSDRTYINVPAGSTSKFTFSSGFKTVDDIYAKTFGSNATNPKFRYNGNVIDKDTFTTLFTVEDHGEAIDGDSNYADFYLTPKAADEFSFTDGFVYATMTSDTTATIFTAVENPGVPASGLVAVYGLSDGGHTLTGWDHVVDLGAASAGNVSTTINLEPGKLYYYRLVATNATKEVWASPSPAAIYSMMVPGSPTNVWTGAVSTDSRVDGNWSLGHVPAANETVFVFDRFYNVRLDWYSETGTDTVAGWVQPADFADQKHQVFFHTTASAPLTVTGNIELGAGTWTHGGPADEPTEMVNVSVGGAMTVGSNARIVAGTSANYNDNDGAPRGYSADHGPGYLRTAGGSFAGEGGHITNTTGFVSYGSIVNPLSYGSGGHGDDSKYGGGGIVKLDVGGALTVDGLICSRGFGYAIWGVAVVGGAGSGGSINITAASLAGSGAIDANGGSNGGYGPGSGGRVKVALTGTGADFTSFTGTIEANGGGMQNANDAAAYDVSPAAAGTVCLVTAGSNPIVKVDNVFRYGNDPVWRVPTGESIPPATHLPAMQNADSLSALKHTKWELSGHGAIRLTRDVQIASLSLSAADGTQMVYTDGYTLTTAALYVNGTRLRGTYTKDNAEWVAGEGSVTVGGSGFVVTIR